MKIMTCEMSVCISTLTVFDPEIVGRDTGNRVTEQYHRQGFSWRKGNIDFYTVDSLGISVDILLNETVHLAENATWAVQVPFSVISKHGIGIHDHVGDLGECLPPIPPGNYAVIFEQGYMTDWDRTRYYGKDETINNSGSSQWGRLWFNSSTDAEAKILLPGSHDLKLCPHYLDAKPPLRLDAEPLI